MSREDVELVRRAYAHTQATGQVYAERFAPGFVWDMSNYEGWPEQQRYEGAEEHIDQLAKKYLGQDRYPNLDSTRRRVILRIKPHHVMERNV